MIAIIQRVSEAELIIDKTPHALINTGLVVLIGIAEGDDSSDMDYIVKKVTNCRIFPDESNKMNKSLIDIGGDILLVSQFTLLADTKKGNRPSYKKAANSYIARNMYNKSIVAFSKAIGKEVKTGVFAADMKVKLVNDGPVTITFDSTHIRGPYRGF